MIVLHSVTKELGRGSHRQLVLGGIDLVIPSRSKLAILGLPGSGKTTLLNIISGAMEPTSGWVERRCVVSATGGLARHADVGTTVRQLVDRLALLYAADGRELGKFVADFGGFGDLMNVRVRSLPSPARQRLNLALFYGVPCDFYLFDKTTVTNLPGMRERCATAFAARRDSAGMILATANSKAAVEFGGTTAILFQGKLTLFQSARQAVTVHQELQAEYGPTLLRQARQRVLDEEAGS